MRASETVSEASPGSTANQTGVPTQVVQQVQGTQQVGYTPPLGQMGRACEGSSGAVAVIIWPPCCWSHLLTCPYQNVHFATPPLTWARPPGEVSMAQGFPP